MLFCQQCGTDNSEDARFCNQCGAKIARAGEPGGPIDEAEPREPTPVPPTRIATPRPDATRPGHAEEQREERPASAWDPPNERSRESRPSDASNTSSAHGAPPPQGLDVSTVSLSSIGVRSRGKAWGVIVLAVIALLALGAGGMWVALYLGDGSSELVAGTPRAPDVAPDPPSQVEVGDAVPEGEDLETDVITGNPRPVARPDTPRAPNERRPNEPRPSQPPNPADAPRRPNPSREADPSLPEAWTNDPEEQAQRPGDPERPRLPDPQAPADTIPDDSVDWESMEEEDETSDSLDEYLVRVRQFIRQYHAPRARACFEHETRNNDNVRGTVVVRFTILANGQVDDATVVRNSTGLDSLGRCLVTRINGWTLPRPPAEDAPLALEMPFSN